MALRCRAKWYESAAECIQQVLRGGRGGAPAARIQQVQQVPRNRALGAGFHLLPHFSRSSRCLFRPPPSTCCFLLSLGRAAAAAWEKLVGGKQFGRSLGGKQFGLLLGGKPTRSRGLLLGRKLARPLAGCPAALRASRGSLRVAALMRPHTLPRPPINPRVPIIPCVNRHKLAPHPASRP